ncbi:MAG: 4-oxalomesaconate tautomerase [Rhodospirillales bacterium]
MNQTSIPFLFMRGGSSRGPYMRRDDLPKDQNTLAKVLIAAVGGGHPLNIDGVGGGNAVTTKTAMLSRSEDDWADIDYFFAQVAVAQELVDFKPTCGNILAGVGPAALEMGLVPASGETAEIKIRAVNTGARITALVSTPGGAVTYEGDTRIDGVPGAAAPVQLSFMDIAGSLTGALLPTGAPRNTVDGIEVTCMDVAMPMVIARAADFGLTGYESREELDENKAFFARMETVRRKAGAMMGMGDVSQSVTPKFAVLAPPKSGGAVAARYFMPWTAHPTMAVTGSQCIASCVLAEGTVAEGLSVRPAESPAQIVIEHPLGAMEVIVEFSTVGGFSVISAGLVRTARKLAAGELFVPTRIWAGKGAEKT